MSRSYEVLCGDVLVGHLVEDQSGLVTFRISESYRRLRRRPVLSQSFEDDLERVYRPKNRSQLPSFFANLIPEGSLRTLIERQSSIGGVKDFVRIDERALERFATAANLTSDAVMSTMSAVLDEASVAWGRVGPDLPLEAEHRAELAKHWTRVPLLRQLEFPG